MSLEISFSQEQKQSAHLNFEARQGVALLSMSATEIKDYVINSIEQNPFLRETEPEYGTDSTYDDNPYAQDLIDSPEGRGNQADSGGAGDEVPFGDNDPYAGYDSLNRASNDTRDYFFEQLTYQPSLEEHLEEVLGLYIEDDLDRSIGLFLIGNIDDAGYLRVDLLSAAETLGVSLEQIERVLGIIQQGSMPGLGARSVAECLLLQLIPEGLDFPLVCAIVEEHLEDISRGQIRAVAQRTQSTLAEVQEALDIIRSLDPRPGLRFGNDRSSSIFPELQVSVQGEEIHVTLRDFDLPSVEVNQEYVTLFSEGLFTKASEKLLTEQLRQAQSLAENIELRKRTLFQIATCVIEVQKPFFVLGKQHLQPLTMTQVAKQLKVSVSTVSRIANSVYLQSPQGLFLLRYFFTTSSVAGADPDDTTGSETVSGTQIKHLLKQLIEEEDKTNPLSDQALCETLKEKGFTVSRRTVNKYRTALNIPARLDRMRHT